MLEKNQDFVACSHGRCENHWLAVEFMHKRMFQLHKLRDYFTNDLPVLVPS